MSYGYDIFLIITFILIIINHTISLKQIRLFFKHILFYWCCLAFAYFFVDFSAMLLMSVAYKKVCILKMRKDLTSFYLEDIKTILFRIFLLYVLIMSRTRFRVNLHFIVAWMARTSLLETGAMPEVNFVECSLTK